MLDFNIVDLLIVFLVLLFSLSVHESAHAWTANWLGDPTARRLGRISLNPAVHIDPIGTLLLPLLAFSTGAPIIGWAKPVPVNPGNLGQVRRDFMMIAAAGPISNVVLAAIASFVMTATETGALDSGGAGAGWMVYAVARLAFQLNLLLAVFNMIPVPPLDGGNVLVGLLPESLAGPFDRTVRRYGFVILYAFLLTGALRTVIWPVYTFLAWLLRP